MEIPTPGAERPPGAENSGRLGVSGTRPRSRPYEDLEAALQARDGWRRVGRAYHGPCPVTGAGRDCCFASAGRTGVALGCRQCGVWPAGCVVYLFAGPGAADTCAAQLEAVDTDGERVTFYPWRPEDDRA